MKKLSLKMDELRVETFRTVEAAAPRGTVAGHAFSSSGPLGCQNQCVSEFGCQTFSTCHTDELACQQTDYPGCGN